MMVDVNLICFSSMSMETRPLNSPPIALVPHSTNEFTLHQAVSEQGAQCSPSFTGSKTLTP